ncbi:hypothetical protein CI109_100671 [Kwoniella shandongensis]|uniref:Cation/H+ exchanger transmembrane domain-containing protein n=1 Tax=Kwoniella shandongensis TaxID=1734106 RepID=A0A5M6C0P0_9TREE|nr:uncharacterized protein CI109_003408 [Kwoniella shandongensis]KAA5528120.1 hypothetical protein CI109_003408 [Kwoniella shandongensis]
MWSSFTYHEPSPTSLLILTSWLYLLNLFGWLSQYILSAQLLGQILIGIIYGTPLAGWLDESWEEAFVVLGYVGLLLLVFEGGLSSSFSQVISLLHISLCVALTGILLPIGLSFIVIPLASSTPLHAFAAGAALSSTSLGTSLSVLNPTAIGFDLRRTRLGTALLSAAVMDDVVAFVLASILKVIGDGAGKNSEIGKNVGRTIGVTIGLGIIILPITRYGLLPLYLRLRRGTKWRTATWGGEPLLIALMVCMFVGMIAAAGYAGTSPLFGAYVAGLACAYIADNEETENPTNKALDVEVDGNDSTERGRSYPLTRINTFPGARTASSSLHLPNDGLFHRNSTQSTTITPNNDYDCIAAPAPTLRSAFHHFLTPLLEYLLIPIFFGSIGYSIPFIPLWRGRIIWRGIIYALLMILGKAFCGLWIVLWPSIGKGIATRGKTSWKGALFLGSAMIARGEIGLLISQIAYNTENPLLTEDEFLIVNWGIILCTIVGPLGVGWMVKRWRVSVTDGGWD